MAGTPPPGRGRLFIVSPVRGDYRRCQAEIPPIVLCRFPEPAQSGRSSSRCLASALIYAFCQIVNEGSDAGRHICTADEHGVENFLITGIERFEEGDQSS